MSTEPQLKAENVWAATKGAAASTIVISCLVIWSVIEALSIPNDDGALRGAVSFLGFIPLIFGVLFVYYLALSAKKDRPFGFAFLVQLVFTVPLSVFVFWAISQNGIVLTALAYGVATFLFCSFAGGMGAWAWSKPSKP